MRLLNKLVLGSCFALAGAGAMAETARIQYVGTDPAAPVLTTSVTDAYATGILQFQNLVTNSSFFAYCIEPAQPFAPAEFGAKNYTVTSFSEPQEHYLQGLFSSSFASVDTATEHAAFQLAIWEIVGENAGQPFDVSLNSGSFFLKPSEGVDVAAMTQLTNQYLAQALAYSGQGEYILTKLTNSSYQDLVTVTTTPIPEPSGYAMMLAGLCAIGAIARRRQQR